MFARTRWRRIIYYHGNEVVAFGIHYFIGRQTIPPQVLLYTWPVGLHVKYLGSHPVNRQKKKKKKPIRAHIIYARALIVRVVGTTEKKKQVLPPR